MTQQNDNDGEQGGNAGGGIKQLLGCGAGVAEILLAEGLRDNDRASGDKGGEDEDQERIKGIDQRNARDSRLAGVGDHHGVNNADGDGQDLLNDQWENQFEEVASRKERRRGGLCGCRGGF